MKLTKTTIKALRYQGDGRRADWHVDDALPKHGVLVYPSGKKSFAIQYRIHGRQRLFVLGSADLLTLAQSRERARRHLVGLLDGIDPHEQRNAAAKAPTWGELSKSYWEAKGRNLKTKRHIRRRLEIMDARWKKTVPERIDRADVVRLHDDYARQAPVEANRIIELFRAVLRWGQKHGQVPATVPDPSASVDMSPERPRDVWIKPDLLPRLAEALNAEFARNPFVGGFLWLALLCGARRNELLNARWNQVDLERGVLTLPTSKTGDERRIVLSEPARAVLKALPKVDGNPHVFPGRKPGQPLVKFRPAWQRVREHVGMPEIRVHDLRRSFASLLVSGGVDLFVVSRLLGHNNLATTQSTYARFADQPLHEAAGKLGEIVSIDVKASR